MHTEFWEGNLNERKRRREREDDIKMGFRKVGCRCVDCINLTHYKGE